ncbi:26S proteasome non-ATPase regulatory subunit 6 [Actinomortierella ambigua]|uniref:26S proteasome non-ATPase regulatory subunit 6 n=1 Tax=Actinomortierella ambigua TaxID=1343610 RepID=A0A9P6U8T0_9FUNG|nr:26S proteasome non-ATPase regulatory subunit 6 [Actinomortierella ambigua]KAG0264113.1 26S proteasome non-ATPase regulatory subunit 6 [Actinomortierella ambigua]
MSLSEEVPKIPSIELLQQRFLVTSGPKESHAEAQEAIMKKIKEDHMAPFYQLICEEQGWPVDKALLSQLEKENEETLKKLDDRLKDAEENLGETEISDALLAKAEHFAKIGEKEKSLTAYRVAFDKTVALGGRLDILFALIRSGFFYHDNDLVSKNIEKARSMIEEGGDWDRRNRLKVYEGTYLLTIRNFKGAADLFLDTLSTFTSVELLAYKEFITYAVLSSMVALKRVDIKKKVIDSPEVLEVLHEIPHLEDYLRSLYAGDYAKFFVSLAALETDTLKKSWVLFPHYRFYVREMRIRGYAQLLESYRSLTIQNMAQAFGVSEEFIDRDVSKFIAAGRLNCVIDKVNGIIETNRPDAKNAQYQQTIKHGDILLNRVQKLSRVINV